MRSRVLVVLIAVLCCVGAVPASAVAKDDHRQAVDFGPFHKAQAFDVTIDSEHRPVAVGTAVVPVDDTGRRHVWTMARFRPSGWRDWSFGKHRGTIADFVPFDGTAQAVTDRPGGGYFVAGVVSDQGQVGYAIAAIEDDGRLDTSWGDGGTVSQLGDSRRSVHGLSVDPDGAVVLLTTSVPEGLPDVVIYETDGAFRSEAVGDHVDVDSVDDELRLPDGRFVSVEDEYDEAGGSFVEVAAFQADGSSDPGFGQGGLVRHAVGDGEFHASAIRAGGSGRVLVAGLLDDGAGRQLLLLRLRADGSVDPSFGDEGLARVGTPGDRPQAVDDVRRLSTGRILVAGKSEGVLRVWAVDPDGSMAAGFREIYDLNPSRAAAVAVDRRHIYTAGRTTWTPPGSTFMLLITRTR